MKVIQEIRLENLRMLLAEAGSVGKLADKLERSQPQVSQLLNESKDKAGKKKRIGDSQARYIEAAFGLERGWMDHDHSSLAAQLAVVIAAEKLKATDEYVEKNMTAFVAPNSPIRLRVQRDSIVKEVEQTGDQRDLFRDGSKKRRRG